MSWQHIDEHTYIDDTLLTCAEYQLFIDEMREQGKYFQPDHWTSYQFSEKQMREPILGVRNSDAVAFCEWLTQRQVGEWKFRLPKQEEAKAFPTLTSGTKSPLGYWTEYWEEEEAKAEFFWVDNLRHLNSRGLKWGDGLNIDQDFSADPSLTLDFIFGSFYSKDFYRENGLDHYFVLDRYRELDISRYLQKESIAPYLRQKDGFTRYIPQDHRFNLELLHSRDLINFIQNTQAIEGVHAKLKGWAHFFRIQFHYDSIIDNLVFKAFRTLRRKFNRSQNIDLLATLDLYFDLLTLQERIAGRSPAFEGIRLVKERIR